MANAQPAGRGRPKRTLLQALIYWCLVLTVWGVTFVVAFFAMFAPGLPDISSLDEAERRPSISYLGRSGALLSVRGSQAAPAVSLDRLPKHVPQAFIAVEDRWYYWHPGFNPWGIVRSQIYNMQHKGEGRPLRGGSTITQQLARNLFLNMDQTYRRKAQELVLAVKLEVQYSKKQILETYLNRVYFGGGAYGIEAASQRYFDKSAKDLTVGEAALLAGLLKAPSRYSPGRRASGPPRAPPWSSTRWSTPG